MIKVEGVSRMVRQDRKDIHRVVSHRQIVLIYSLSHQVTHPPPTWSRPGRPHLMPNETMRHMRYSFDLERRG